MSAKPNRLLRLVQKINGQVPKVLRPTVLSLAFNSYIRYAGTTGLKITRWDADEAVVICKNRWHIQNHIGGVHATAMATLAESATGMLFGLHVPDSKLPLLKSLHVDYKAVARGDLTAVATLSKDQMATIESNPKGAMVVPVRITDSEGKEPIQCQMEWAWITKKIKEES
jgi:acyl-coenzyme A thioesterase PaaI-like protein